MEPVRASAESKSVYGGKASGMPLPCRQVLARYQAAKSLPLQLQQLAAGPASRTSNRALKSAVL